MESIPHTTLSHNINSSIAYMHLSTSPSLSTKNNGTDTPNSEISTISSGSPLASTNSSRDSLVASTTSTKPVLQQQRLRQQQRLDFSAIREAFSNDTKGLESGLEQSQSPLWYVLTAAVLLSYHKEKLIGELWAYVTSELRDDDDEVRLSVARRIREACLKSSTLVGFPRVSQPTIHPMGSSLCRNRY